MADEEVDALAALEKEATEFNKVRATTRQYKSIRD